MSRIAIVGFGEIGRFLAERAAEASYDIYAYDAGLTSPSAARMIRAHADRLSVHLVEEIGELGEADVGVFLAVPADATARVIEELAASGVRATVIDVSSAPPSVKGNASALLDPALYVDVAIIGSPALGGHLQCLVAGSNTAARLLDKLGLDVTVISQMPGDAAALKSLWQVVTKGLQALCVEALAAADAFGIEYTPPPSIMIDGLEQTFDLPFGLLEHLMLHSHRKSRDLEETVRELERIGFDAILSNAAARVLAAAPELLAGTRYSRREAT